MADVIQQVRLLVNSLPDDDNSNIQEFIEGQTIAYHPNKQIQQSDDTQKAVEKSDIESLECEWLPLIHTAWCNPQMAKHVNSCIVCYRKWNEDMGR